MLEHLYLIGQDLVITPQQSVEAWRRDFPSSTPCISKIPLSSYGIVDEGLDVSDNIVMYTLQYGTAIRHSGLPIIRPMHLN